jgi:hypothetical protein
MLKKRTVAVLALAVAAIVALAAAACSDSDVKEEDIDAANERITGLEERVTKGQLLAWRNAMRAEDLHGLDEEISDADAVDDGWISQATRAHEATASVTWPADMADAGAELAATLASLEESLSGGNLETAKTAATDAHDQYHDLDHDVSSFLTGEEHAPEETEAAH